jgi:hypothetical protein
MNTPLSVDRCWVILVSIFVFFFFFFCMLSIGESTHTHTHTHTRNTGQGIFTWDMGMKKESAYTTLGRVFGSVKGN